MSPYMIKSIFISVYPVLCLVGLYFAFDQYTHGYVFASIGMILVSSIMLVFLSKLFLTNVPRTSSSLKPYSFIVGVGTGILIYAFIIGRAESITAFGFILSLGWLAYVYWYSILGDRSNQILVKGQQLPLLHLEDEQGKSVSSESFKGKKSILMFYRGNWCPLCMAQIKEISEEYKTLEAKGIQTILISPQSHKNTLKLAEKYKVGFKFLVDKGNKVARQLNIFAKNGLPAGFQVLGYDSDTVMPTVILLDKNGTIIHSDLNSNYRVRPEPSELIKHFES